MLIGITGKAGAGKDTVADYLVSTYAFKRYAFADAVREIALSINPLLMTNWETGEYLHSNPKLREFRLLEAISKVGWDRAKREMPEVRRLLQVIGTEAGRSVMGENVWVDIVAKKWDADGRPDAVVTDMRFPNEFEWVEEIIDEITLRIERPDNPNAIVTTHASEAYDFDCRFTLTNNGTLENLYTSIDTLMEDLQTNGR